jgi:C1A family cysteine protease
MTEFWNDRRMDFQGGHAVSIVGYNDEGFILRNSWGRTYGDNGYSVIPYEDFNKFMEIWTIY